MSLVVILGLVFWIVTSMVGVAMKSCKGLVLKMRFGLHRETLFWGEKTKRKTKSEIWGPLALQGVGRSREGSVVVEKAHS